MYFPQCDSWNGFLGSSDIENHIPGVRSQIGSLGRPAYVSLPSFLQSPPDSFSGFIGVLGPSLRQNCGTVETVPYCRPLTLAYPILRFSRINKREHVFQ